MIIALFIIAAAVVSMPIAAIVIVSMASRREDAAYSLGDPAPGLVQAAARRLLDFHTEDPAWQMPKNYSRPRPAAPTPTPTPAPAAALPSRGSARQPRRSTVTDTGTPAATSKTSVRTAA